MAWRQLGIAHGREGQLGDSYLALAEASALQGHKDDARDFLKRAKKHLKNGSPAWIRVEDLSHNLERDED